MTQGPHWPKSPSGHRDVHELLTSARRGRGDALGQIFEAAREQLLELAHRELPENLRAKIGPSDIVQETAVDMQRDFTRFRGTTPEECFAWLRSILRNNLIDAVRRYDLSQKRGGCEEWSLATTTGQQQGEAVPFLGAGPDGSAIRREDAAAVSRILALLPDDQRTVLQLRYWNGLSFVDIATRLDRSPDAIRKLWFRAIERLNDELAASRPPATTDPR